MRVWVALIFLAAIGLAWCLRFSLMLVGALLIGDWHVFAFLCSLPGALCCWSLLRERADADAALVSVCFVAGVTLLAGFKWFSRDYFLADFWRVHAGMTEPQVELMLGKYVKGGRYLDAGPRGISLEPGEVPPPGAPELPLCQSYRHSTDSLWNADWGRVCYRQGLVVSTDFSPD